MAEIQQLTLRKLADKSEQERVARFDPFTGQKMLVNPANCNPDDLADVGNWAHEPWPLAGVKIDDPPQRCRVSTSLVALARSEGWATVEGESVVHRPGGPVENPWRVTHTFVQADAIVFNTVDGDIRYRVIHHPDKYVDCEDPTESVTDEIYAAGETRIDWFYDLLLESGRSAQSTPEV